MNNNKQIEEILDDNWSSGLTPNDYPDCIIIHRKEVFKAMQEYAAIKERETAIGFWNWVDHIFDPPVGTWPSDDELFNLYLESLDK